MPVINISVQNKIAVVEENAFIVCGNSDYQIKFSFDSEWAGCNFKTALFVLKGKILPIVFTGDTCDVPVINGTSILAVGVTTANQETEEETQEVLSKQLSTTTPAYIPCKKSAKDLTDEEIEEPTPSQYEEIIRLLNEYVGMGVPSTEDIEEIAGKVADDKILIAKDEIEDKIKASHIVNITKIEPVEGTNRYPTLEEIQRYADEAYDPSLLEESTRFFEGDRYVVAEPVSETKTNLFYYTYVKATHSWKKDYQIKGSTLYINIADSCMYRYTMTIDTGYYPNFIKLTKSVSDIDEELATKQDNLSFDGEYNAETNKVATVKTVDNKIDALINGADTSFDTLKEIADWIKDHPNSVTEINSKIQENTVDILANEKAIANLNGLVSLLKSDKQNKNDSGLHTSSKLIVGAINEINSKVTQLGNSSLTESEVKEIVRETAVTTESDPTVPDWAKQPEKPTYTYEEIKGKPDLVEDIGSSLAEETNVLTIELKDKSGKVIASTEVTIPKGGETPDLSVFVKNTDYATSGSAGIVIVGEGLSMSSTSHKLNIAPATTAQIEGGTGAQRPITVGNFKKAVKEGIVNSDEEWTDDDKASARDLIGAVGNKNYATDNVGGVLRSIATFGFKVDAYGRGQIVKAENADIEAKSNEYKPIVPKTLEYAVMKALSDCKLEWTDEQKAKARALLGIE